MNKKNTPITVAYGDGIGPEIMESTLHVLEQAGASIEIERIEIGEKVYRDGISSGIRPEAWESLRSTGIFLKAPITTPQGGGVKSLNVTIRKTLGLYANVRPCRAYAPFVKTNYPEMDVVIIRENEEDLYAGIEHRQTDEVVQCLKLVSRPGCEKIIRYGFEYARARNRKKVTCFTKDNIMKLTDGLFHEVFNEVALEYPELDTEHMIVDIGMARMATTPERFDVVIAPNLYGDILSDVAAEVSGSVGLAGSANIGNLGAMFEAVHGSASDIAGQNIANPSGLLLSAVKMLAHIGQGNVAEHIHNAWLRAIEEGIHTLDVYSEQQSKKRVGTREFADAVVARLGELPQVLKPVRYKAEAIKLPVYHRKEPAKRELVGIDVFLYWRGNRAEDLAAQLLKTDTAELQLSMITNRGVKVWPDGFPETFCTDHWRCRFLPVSSETINQGQIVKLLDGIAQGGLEFIKAETLCTFNGRPGYSLGQGQ